MIHLRARDDCHVSALFGSGCDMKAEVELANVLGSEGVGLKMRLLGARA